MPRDNLEEEDWHCEVLELLGDEEVIVVVKGEEVVTMVEGVREK